MLMGQASRAAATPVCRRSARIALVNRLERLYAVSEELRRAAPRARSASWLAERFDVSRRTIERDLAALRNAGLPTYPVDGPHGGVAVHTNGPRALLSLTTAELTALALAATVVRGMPFGWACDGAVAKLTDALPAEHRVALDDLRARVRVVPPEPPRPPARVAAVVEDGVRRGTVVRLAYVDRNGAATERDVEPVGFHGDAEGWYLVAWCRLRHGGRVFRLDRVRSATATTERAPPRDYDEVLGWVPRRGTVAGG